MCSFFITFKHQFLPVYKSTHFMCVRLKPYSLYRSSCSSEPAATHFFFSSQSWLPGRVCLRSSIFHLHGPPITATWFQEAITNTSLFHFNLVPLEFAALAIFKNLLVPCGTANIHCTGQNVAFLHSVPLLSHCTNYSVRSMRA